MLWSQQEYKSKYHLLLNDKASSRTKNKVRLELGLYNQIDSSKLTKLDELLDFSILTQDYNAIKSCFNIFEKKFFLSRKKQENFLKKFYPFLQKEVETYAINKKIYSFCSYFDAKYIGYNNTQDHFFLMMNYSDNFLEKKEILNFYFSSKGLSEIYINKNKGFCVRSFFYKKQIGDFNKRKVSVIITSYNNEGDIKNSILSILNQKEVEVELIIVDDASNDHTVDEIKDIMVCENRIKAVFLEKNVGTYKARNIALELASSEYLAFQDADDFSHPDRLRESITILEKNAHLLAVSSRYIRLTDKGQFVSIKKVPLIRWSPLTLVFRRQEVFSQLAKFDEVRFGADSEFFARFIATFGEKSHMIIDKVLMICRDRNDSLMKENANFFGLSEKRYHYIRQYNEKILYNLSKKMIL